MGMLDCPLRTLLSERYDCTYLKPPEDELYVGRAAAIFPVAVVFYNIAKNSEEQKQVVTPTCVIWANSLVPQMCLSGPRLAECTSEEASRDGSLANVRVEVE